MVACLGDPKLTAIVRHHHERLDGTGYPAGLAAEQIPIGARIVAVADTFDAIVSTRPYRPAAPHKRAIDVLVGESGAHFDPAVVDAFLGRYSGKYAVALWSVLAVLPQAAFAWQRARRGVRRPSSPGQQAATVGAMAALAAVALAAPGAPKHDQRSAPAAAMPVVLPPPPAGKPRVHPPAPPPRVVSASLVTANATCQAYNQQLCSALSGSGPGTASATAATTVIATGAAGLSATGVASLRPARLLAGPSSAALPFTGVDLLLLAPIAGALVALGLAMRWLARPSD